MQLYIEVETNDNCDGIPERVFSTKGERYQVAQLRLDTKAGKGVLHWATGWSSQGDGSPCPAYAIPVEDSGAGISHLVYGGDWGVRFKPLSSTSPWSAASNDQFGEPYLLLAETSDIIPK